MTDVKILGVLGLLTQGSGFFKSSALATISDPHNSLLCLFLLTGGCRTSSPRGVHVVLIVTSVAFLGLICVNYLVCNHRESDYFLKQVESVFWLS